VPSRFLTCSLYAFPMMIVSIGDLPRLRLVALFLIHRHSTGKPPRCQPLLAIFLIDSAFFRGSVLSAHLPSGVST